MAAGIQQVSFPLEAGSSFLAIWIMSLSFRTLVLSPCQSEKRAHLVKTWGFLGKGSTLVGKKAGMSVLFWYSRRKKILMANRVLITSTVFCLSVKKSRGKRHTEAQFHYLYCLGIFFLGFSSFAGKDKWHKGKISHLRFRWLLWRSRSWIPNGFMHTYWIIYEQHAKENGLTTSEMKGQCSVDYQKTIEKSVG